MTGFHILTREEIGPLLLAVAAVLVVARWVVRPGLAAAVAAVVGVGALVPVQGLSGVDWVTSVTGPLSAASLVLAVCVGAVALRPTRAHASLPVLAAFVLVVAIPLYAVELSGAPLDPYRWGYAGELVPAGLAALLVVGFWLRAWTVASWIALAGVLFLTRAYASRNLFDYLVDPVAVLLALWVLAAAMLRRLRSSAAPAP